MVYCISKTPTPEYGFAYPNPNGKKYSGKFTTMPMKVHMPDGNVPSWHYENAFTPSLRADAIKYVCTCDPCQKIKHDRGTRTGFLQPLEIPATPFEDISLDLITGLPQSRGKNAILVKAVHKS